MSWDYNSPNYTAGPEYLLTYAQIFDLSECNLKPEAVHPAQRANECSFAAFSCGVQY